MANIGIILPYEKLYYEAIDVKEMFKDHKLEIDVKVGLLSNAIDVAKDMINNGAHVLISRGGTLNYLHRHFPNIPLVEIEISSYDIAEAIMKAKKDNLRIALVIFNNMLYEERDLAKLFDVDIKIFYIKREEDVLDTVIKAVKEGYEIMVGGGVCNKVSKQLGIPSILISSGKDSVLRSVRYAQNILRYRRDSLKQSQLIETVIENTPLGIITTDRNGKIKMVNFPALEIVNMARGHIIGRNIEIILPEWRNNNFHFIKEFGKNKTMVNIKYLDIVSSDIGCIITLEKVSEISKKEKYIRSAFIKKGHIAKYVFEDIVGKNLAMEKCIQTAKKYANYDFTVLILGETGTGKEMFAQGIHNASKRSKGPFVAVNCAYFSENLIESELFGYVEGAFTGASKSGKTGLFEMAHRGTIFLDEISEMPLSVQAKLLRVIQEKAIKRLGDDKIIPIDVRIIAASNRDLYKMVKKRKFRADLYYRLNVLNLKIPPLRNREEDIIPLFEKFLTLYSMKFNIRKPILDRGGYDIIKKYHWAGNVRELENFVKRLLVTYDTLYITSDEILSILDIEKHKISSMSNLNPNKPSKNDLYRVLKENDFNKTKTAKQLGVSRTTLWRWLKKLEKGK